MAKSLRQNEIQHLLPLLRGSLVPRGLRLVGFRLVVAVAKLADAVAEHPVRRIQRPRNFGSILMPRPISSFPSEPVELFREPRDAMRHHLLPGVSPRATTTFVVFHVTALRQVAVEQCLPRQTAERSRAGPLEVVGV